MTDEQQEYDVAIIGGGIIGCATAMVLAERPGIKIAILEAEDHLAAHQTGHNSGVVHSGLYYKPGSLKARNCTEGREALYKFCEEHSIAYDRCGKIVVATAESELQALEELERRGKENGLEGIERIGPEEIHEIEPHMEGIAGLRVPQTGIVDYIGVTKAFASLVEKAGGTVHLSTRLTGCVPDGDTQVLETTSGTIRAKNIINCSGLQSDRVARLCGVDPGLKIVPFRGEYYELAKERHDLVKHLVYPVPDPRFPFLGVHFTRMVLGGVEAGPNAVLALKREGYKWTDISIKDIASYMFYIGFWRMAAKFWYTAFGEVWRSFSKRAFVKALQKLMPSLQMSDIERAGAGVRAQALEPTGNLSDDFKIVEAEHQIHVLNAPSPAATASIAIGRAIAKIADKRFDLKTG
jgi:(S)-2-hydroxyglutarate dehydrogenase